MSVNNFDAYRLAVTFLGKILVILKKNLEPNFVRLTNGFRTQI